MPVERKSNTHKVLVIESDASLAGALSRELEAGGCVAAAERDGAAGLSHARAWRPEAILLGGTQTAMGGYEFLEEKQKDPALASIPVVAILNAEQAVEVNRALALGVRDYLIRGRFTPAEAAAKVALQLGKGEKSAEQNKTPEKSAGPAAADLHGKKIMWVEDDKFLSDIIARKLGVEGCVLAHAASGEEALKALKNEPPDLLLLDILLPGIDGFEILRRIKEEPKTRRLPVILLSNLGRSEDVEKGKKLGAARFLIKATVTLDEIVGEIKTVLQEARAAAHG